MNLVANSRDAMPGGGTVRIATSLADIDEQETRLYVGLKSTKHVKLRIADTGHGIPPEIQPHIFEPFFSTKSEEGKGNGLGLATVYAIVHQHEGHIRCESAIEKGTEFTIFLPAAEKAASLAPQVPAPKIRRQGRETILLVEDQPALRASVRRILEQSGYKVVVASDGLEALKASEGDGAFELLVTDIALPQMRGTELAQRLLQLQPQLRVLYMSGYSEEKVPPDAGHFIAKPFRREALLRKIREVLDS
jgi:two-component system cell cycle sensor histidine kinase/response regulator CckA